MCIYFLWDSLKKSNLVKKILNFTFFDVQGKVPDINCARKASTHSQYLVKLDESNCSQKFKQIIIWSKYIHIRNIKAPQYSLIYFIIFIYSQQEQNLKQKLWSKPIEQSSRWAVLHKIHCSFAPKLLHSYN